MASSRRGGLISDRARPSSKLTQKSSGWRRCARRSNATVVLLGATSALVNYQIDYKVRPTDGKKVESTSRRVTAAWAQRKGRWWYVYFEDRLVQEDRFVAPWPEQPFWRLSDKLRDLNEPIFEPKKH